MSNKAGVLWKKTTREGKSFLSGVIDVFPFGQVSIAIWPNEYKTKDNQPDYSITYQAIGSQQSSPDSNNQDGSAVF